MSNNENKGSLTYQRAKAVKLAWLREVKLVKQGKGTRQWTLDEQRELLTTGRIKKYVGHHIKSVKTFAQYAGEQKNIQFLTRSEHYRAHLYNWKNSLNNLYNVEKKSWDGRFNENVKIDIFKLKNGLSELEKTEIQKLVNNKKKEEQMTNNSLYQNEYNNLFSQVKNRIDSLYDNCKGRSLNETANNMALSLRMSAQEKQAVINPIVYEKANNQSVFLNAYCETLATNKFLANHKNEIFASHGRTTIPNELQEFKESQSKKCEENFKKCKELIENTSEKLVEFHKECAEKARDLYVVQKQQWQTGSQSAKTLDQSQEMSKKVQKEEENAKTQSLKK